MCSCTAGREEREGSGIKTEHSNQFFVCNLCNFFLRFLIVFFLFVCLGRGREGGHPFSSLGSIFVYFVIASFFYPTPTKLIFFVSFAPPFFAVFFFFFWLYFLPRKGPGLICEWKR